MLSLVNFKYSYCFLIVTNYRLIVRSITFIFVDFICIELFVDWMCDRKKLICWHKKERRYENEI